MCLKVYILHFMKLFVVVHMALSQRQSITLPGRDDVTNCLIQAFKPFKKIFALFLRIKKYQLHNLIKVKSKIIMCLHASIIMCDINVYFSILLLFIVK